MAPVALRDPRPDGGQGDTTDAGNRIGCLICGLATDLAGSDQRLAAVRDSMYEGKARAGLAQPAPGPRDERAGGRGSGALLLRWIACCSDYAFRGRGVARPGLKLTGDKTRA